MADVVVKSRMLRQLPVDATGRNPAPGSADSRPPSCIPTYQETHSMLLPKIHGISQQTKAGNS